MAPKQVQFPFSQALPLARTLWQLANQVETTQTARAAAARTAIDGWLGNFRDDFVQRMNTANTDAPNLKQALQLTANGIAESWAKANHQQQTYNYYDNVQQARDNVSGWDKFWGDDTDYGKPPAAPAVPSPPDFAPTQIPQAFVPH